MYRVEQITHKVITTKKRDQVIVTMQAPKIKTKIKFANGGRRAENKIWDNSWFILSARASHFRSVRKTISIPEDLGHRCD
jgi:REP element-mobilizing transposase RayT